MKKLLLCLLCCALCCAVASCHKKAAATPGVAAKQYAEYIMRNDYDSFVEAISFVEPVPDATQAAAGRAHAEALRAIHLPRVNERGGIREIKVLSEKFSPDNNSCDVTLAAHYDNGVVSTVDMHMVNDYETWKIRETPLREIWRATTSEGDTEILKVRTGSHRDFIKNKNRDFGEKQFVKDINRANGEVEVIKVLENGRRHREVIKTRKDGTVEEIRVR